MEKSNIYEIKNDVLSLKVNAYGGTFESLTLLKENKELIYQIEEGGWKFKDVVIFPFISKGDFIYKNNHYIVNSNHGLIRNSLLEVYEHSENSITFKHSSNEDDLKQYPFNFDFYLTYKLVENTIVVKAKIKNNNDIYLYFSFGHHPAFKIDLNNSYLEGGKEYFPINEQGLLDVDHKLLLNKEKLALTKESITSYKTLVLDNFADNTSKNSSIKKYTLETGLGYKVIYNMPSTFVAVWSSDIGNFICVEPWFGVSNIVDEERELEKRRFLNKLEPNSVKEFEYSINIDY